MTQPETDDDIDAPDDVDDPEIDDGPTASRLEGVLREAIEMYCDAVPDARIRVETYEEAGVLTRDRGLVVRMGGRAFQVTIVRSR